MRFKKALLSGLLGQPTISAQVLAQLRRRDDSLLIPGIGVVDGFSSGTYSDSAGATPAVLNDFLGRWVDAGAGGLVFTQATTPNKPLLTKRVNLLTKTHDFSDPIWVKSEISANSTATAGEFRIVASTANSVHGVSQFAPESYNLPYMSIEARADGARYIAIGNSDQSAKFSSFDLQTGAKGFNPNLGRIDALGDEWYRIICKPFGDNSNNATAACQIRLVNDLASNPNTSTFAGDGVSGVIIRKPQYQPVFGSVATVAHPRYQWVNTATDYDTVGFQYRVRFKAGQTLSASIPSIPGYADTTIISALPGGQVTLTGQNLSGVTHTIGPSLDLLGRIYAFNGSSLTAAELALYQRYMNNLAGVA